MTLDIDADPCGVAQCIGYDGFGAPQMIYWTAQDIDGALAEIARLGTDRIRMTSNGSPVIEESDLIEMRAAIRRAQEQER